VERGKGPKGPGVRWLEVPSAGRKTEYLRRGVLMGSVAFALCAALTPDAWAQMGPVARADLVAVALGPADDVAAALRAEEQVRYRGSQIVVEYQDGREQLRSTQEVVCDGPNQRMRVEVSSPGDLAGTVTIQDGTDRWQFDPSTRRWLHQSAPAERYVSFEESIDLLFRNYTIESGGEETVAGRTCRKYDVLPRMAGNPSRRLFVDSYTHLPLRTENVNGMGELFRVVCFTSVSFPDAIDADRFAPPQERVREDFVERWGPMSLNDAASSVDFPLAEPGYIPSGYRFAGAVVLRKDFQYAAHLQWYDGLSLISLFKQRSGTTLPSTGWEESHANSVSWVSMGYYYTLVGDVVPGELSQIRDSVR
jgi:hypothetical protein